MHALMLLVALAANQGFSSPFEKLVNKRLKQYEEQGASLVQKGSYTRVHYEGNNLEQLLASYFIDAHKQLLPRDKIKLLYQKKIEKGLCGCDYLLIARVNRNLMKFEVIRGDHKQ